MPRGTEKLTAASASTNIVNRDRRLRIPWAALLAAAIVLAVDGFGLRYFGPWTVIADQAGVYDPNRPRKGLDFGVAHDRQQLAALRREPPEYERALVVGSSRVAVGFDTDQALEQLPRFRFGKIGHAGLDAFVVRSMVDDLLDAEPDVALFLLSEYDTHRPVRIEPTPGKSSASMSALFDLANLIGGDFLLRQREFTYRLAASRLLESYRYRRVLARTRIRHLRDFRTPPRLAGRQLKDFLTAVEHTPITYWDGERQAVPRKTRQMILGHFGDRPRQGDRGLSFVAETQLGDHARVNMSLLEHALSRLQAQGVAVAILEGPIHPAAPLSYHPQARQEFRGFARRLAREYGIAFIPLEAMPEFPDEEFVDLLHLAEPGVRKLTRAITQGIELTAEQASP